MSRRDKTLYLLGSPLWIASGFLFLYHLGAPMDVVWELVKTIVALFLISGGFFFAAYALINKVADWDE